MPVNFNLLAREGPTNFLEGLVQGQEQQNALIQKQQEQQNALFQQQQQRQLGNIQLRNALRAEEEALAESEAARSSSSLEDLAKRQRLAGLGKQSLATEAAIAKRNADKAAVAKTQIELLRASAGQIMANPGSAVQILNRFGQMTGMDMSDDIAQIQGKDPEAIRNWAAGHALNADKLYDFTRAQTEASQIRPQPQVGAMPSVGAPAATENALGTPVTGVSNAMVAQPATPAAAAPTTFAAGRLARVEQEIGQMQNILANYPDNKRAAEILKAAVDERDKLVAQDLASRKFEQEKKTAIEYIKTTKGVIKVNKADGTSELVLDPDGKPVMDISAAQAAETVRSNIEREKADRARLELERQRVALQRQADARAEYQARQPKFDASAGGFVYPPSKENPQGKIVPVLGIEGKAPNEAQGNAIAYGVRMDGANKILENLEKEGVTSGGRLKGFVSGTLQSLVPYQGEKLAAGAESVMRPFSSEKQNNYEQAKENFITAVLRKESGAAIGQTEFATEERKYFPQVGDSDSTIKQKQEARRLAISAMRQIAGPFAKNIDAISSGAAGGPSTGAATSADPLGLFGKK